jgi:hypothetical protein
MITSIEVRSGIYNKNKYQHTSFIYSHSYIVILTAALIQDANNKGGKSLMTLDEAGKI